MNIFIKNRYLIIFILFITKTESVEEDFNFEFPKDFLFGAATSAYQIEGAWNISDKSESNLDYYIHNYPEKIADRSSGDLACDSYHKYKDDIALVKNIGLQFYRFSISWPRLLLNGTPDYISKEGLSYYNNIINELKKQGIEPFVTIYHYDHPQIYETLHGGWLNESMAYLYSEYANVVFREFGDRVKFFTTINEPNVYCLKAYKLGILPPWVKSDQVKYYECQHNMLKGHGLAYHIYNDKYRKTQNGKVGILNHCGVYYGENETLNDIAYEFDCGLTANPIFSKSGDYPEILKTRIATRSKLQGYNSSKLPTFTEDWIKKIKGSSDYFGLNHYTTFVAKPLPESDMLNWPSDEGFETSFDPNWKPTAVPIFKIVPEAFRKLLQIVKDKYGNPDVYILESGVAVDNDLDDDLRIEYLRSYLKEMLKAINIDKANVKSYAYWSLLDNFEWHEGYTQRFGLISVNMSSSDRSRQMKKSAKWLQNVIAARKIV